LAFLDFQIPRENLFVGTKKKGKKRKKGGKNTNQLFSRRDVGFFRFLPHRKNIDAGVVSSLSASFAFEQARTVSYTSRPVS